MGEKEQLTLKKLEENRDSLTKQAADFKEKHLQALGALQAVEYLIAQYDWSEKKEEVSGAA